ncbi:Eukaryotic aspartyl protease family protein [Euphorbia peplus]|nr:Eukaryotic aspartyl protease family protein [Euphorbia peplus]
MYFLNLRDISIESYPLNIPPGTFARTRDGSGGCVIDSGTSFTRLIMPAYQLVIWAFQVYYGSYGLIRVHAPETGFELCYKMSARLPKFASMTYHFEGANFKVEQQYLHMKVPGRDVFCVELLREQRQTVLGALQQINTRFIYDARARQI